MNGLKNLLAICINGVAAIYFGVFGAVVWRDGIIMAARAIAGGYFGARVARRLGRNFVSLRFSRRDVFIALGMSSVLLVFQFFFGRGAHEIANAHLPPAGLASAFVFGFIWLCVEAGLVEVYFFRRLVQTRLESFTRSRPGGILLASLLFGLVHAPGLYLRTSHTGEALGNSPSLLLAVGYAIVVVSPTGFFLGTLWSRTRNLAIVVVVHAMGDLLPNVVDLARHFS